jgi:hypothetical protein
MLRGGKCRGFAVYTIRIGFRAYTFPVLWVESSTISYTLAGRNFGMDRRILDAGYDFFFFFF